MDAIPRKKNGRRWKVNIRNLNEVSLIGVIRFLIGSCKNPYSSFYLIVVLFCVTGNHQRIQVN